MEHLVCVHTQTGGFAGRDTNGQNKQKKNRKRLNILNRETKGEV